MVKSRLIAVSAGALTLLLSAGTALALGADRGATSVASVQPTTSDTSTSTSTSTVTSTGAPHGDEAISPKLATEIALGHVGGGTVTQVERELEDGRVEWKVRIVKDGQRFDVRVDATTGAITRVQTNDDHARGDDKVTPSTTHRGDIGDDRDRHDDHDDSDNSGPGNGDDDDDSNSGPGSGDDDRSGGH